jgi:hypothetical protein
MVGEAQQLGVEDRAPIRRSPTDGGAHPIEEQAAGHPTKRGEGPVQAA